jgi:hypothetical protein
MKPGAKKAVIAALFLAAMLPVGCRQQHDNSAQGSLANPNPNIQNETGSEDANDPSALLRSYCNLDEQQQYEKLYTLLSKRQKKNLQRVGVGNSAQYEQLRESSEAAWSSFVVERKSIGADGAVTFVGRATIEENGETERVKFKARVVKEDEKWKLDAWKY